MPIQMNQDSRLNELWAKLHTDSTGWCDRVEAIVDSAFNSATNIFGTAALRDTGIAAGNVPEITGADAQLPLSTIPSLDAARFSGPVPPGRIPNLHVNKIILDSPGVPDSVDRVHLNRLPASIPIAAFTFDRVGEDVLPAKTPQITSVTGTPVVRNFEFDARANDDGGPGLGTSSRPRFISTGSIRINVPTGRAPNNVTTASLAGGSASLSSAGVLTINPVIATLVGVREAVT